ncbi:MAG: hypothetical protein MJZ26_06205 [Fibrobacter sp.]|nr:hypothetical protein [Fibrobacter sp.]
MIKKLSLLAGICAMGLMTACSDDSTPDPTKAELCGAGITHDCLVGTWTAKGAADKNSGAMFAEMDYSGNPGSLILNKDGSFEFDLPPMNPNAGYPDCNPVYGTWTVEGAVLNLASNINNMCLYSKKANLTPKVEVVGAEVKLSFEQMWFFYGDTDEMAIRNTGTEIFTISASAK